MLGQSSLLLFSCAVLSCAFATSLRNNLKSVAEEFVKDLNDTRETYEEIASNLLQEDLDRWVAPEELRRDFTYYWSGVDEECRPIWVGQMGRWNVRGIVERGAKSRESFRKYIEQMVFNIGKSVKMNQTDCENPDEQVTGIIDLDGFNYFQLSSVATVDFILNLLKEFVPIILKHVHSAYVVNANYVVEALVALIRPILGSLMERVEIYGTKKAYWLPQLLRNLPRSQLPEWYGGDKDFKPVQVYG